MITELREAVAKVKALEEAVDLVWWDDWSVTLAEGVEGLLAALEAIRAIPSECTLLTHAEARAMYEIAARALGDPNSHPRGDE